MSVDLKLSLTEQNLRDEVRAWLDAKYAFGDHLARTANPVARDERLWKAMLDHGWIARTLPNHDALEQSTIDAAIVAEEFGRALVVEPFFRNCSPRLACRGVSHGGRWA